MRVFVLFLFIINLLIGAWIYMQPVKTNLPSMSMPGDLESLVLLSEANVQQEEDQSAVISEHVKTEENKDVAVKVVMMCFTLGPFKDEVLLMQARERLSEQAVNMNVRKREESERHRYWVYLPAMSSRARAREKSKRLAQAKIKDYYIVHSGDKKNAISLGHFKEKKHADHRISRLKRHGFDTKMEVIFRQLDVFWLDYGLEESMEEADELIAEYLVDGVTRLDRSCD